MKIQTLAVAAGVSAPLILTATSDAGFVGLKTTMKDNPFGLLVVNVYAIFDRPGQDHLVAVFGGGVDGPLVIEVIGGVFYRHPLGNLRAPSAEMIELFPSLAFDTFLTIGVKAVDPTGVNGQPKDNLFVKGPFDDLFNGSGGECLCSWAISPNDLQGNPFDAVNSFPGNGQVLIGQFSTLDGIAIQGTMLLQYISNGAPGQSVVSFFHVPGPGALAMVGVAGLLGARRRRPGCTVAPVQCADGWMDCGNAVWRQSARRTPSPVRQCHRGGVR